MAANNNTEKKSDKAVKNAAAPATEKKGVVGWFKNLGIKIGKAFYNMYHELKKVTWPSKKDLYKYTLVVLVMCALFAIFFYLVDTGCLLVLEKVLNIVM